MGRAVGGGRRKSPPDCEVGLLPIILSSSTVVNCNATSLSGGLPTCTVLGNPFLRTKRKTQASKSERAKSLKKIDREGREMGFRVTKEMAKMKRDQQNLKQLSDGLKEGITKVMSEAEAKLDDYAIVEKKQLDALYSCAKEFSEAFNLQLDDGNWLNGFTEMVSVVVTNDRQPPNCYLTKINNLLVEKDNIITDFEKRDHAERKKRDHIAMRRRQWKDIMRDDPQYLPPIHQTSPISPDKINLIQNGEDLFTLEVRRRKRQRKPDKHIDRPAELHA